MQLVFDSYRLDTANQTLHGAAGEVPLMPKTYALLRYLAENPGRLVSKNELLDAVWPRVCVSDTVLKVSVRDLRRALGDDAQAPRYVETLHRRGYRFITAVSTHQAPALAQACAPHDTPAPAPLVGREAELARLDGVLQQALAGARQLLFVSGEPGIGKTALIDAFLTRAVRHPHLFVMRGQCVEPYGEQEAYAPVFDALGGLCRGADRKRWVDLLRCFAPTWFAQMPWLIEAGEREALAQSILGATQERMLRELAELLAACAAEQPLVMILEDLHWSDRATVDLLSYLARRRESARLLLLVSCRPVELIVRDHPLKKLKQDLHMHRQCTELALPMLSPAAVADYLAARFPDHRFPPTLAPAVHRRSDGNPLFMVNMIDLLLARALLCERSGHWRLDTEFGEADIGVPESLRQLIEKQIDQLRPEERRILAAASVAGMEFAAAAVAAMLDDEVIVVEACCRRLARQGSFLRALGLDETTNRASTERFAFIHVLYHDVLYQGLGITYRAQLHRRMGEHAEAAHSARAHVIAAELAGHFEQGHDYPRTVFYLRQAAVNDSQRYAYREACAHLDRAHAIATRLPLVERREVLPALLEQRALARSAMADMAGAAADFAELAQCAEQEGRYQDAVKAALYQASVESWLGRERCLRTVERIDVLSQHSTERALRVHTQGWSSYWRLLWQGWSAADAAACAAAVDAARASGNREQFGQMVCRHGYFQALQSDYRGAWRSTEEGRQTARALGNAADYLLGHYYGVWALLHAGEWGEARRLLDDGSALAERNSHCFWTLLFRLERAWLHEQAFDFDEARRLTEQSLRQAEEAQLDYGLILAPVLLGLAQLGGGDLVGAFAAFDRVAQRLAQERILMDWVVHLPLYHGLSRYWLLRGDFAQARRAALELERLAGQPGERTYRALAYATLVEVAVAECDWNAAERDLARGLEVLAGADAPLAEWRLRAAAAAFYRACGEQARCRQENALCVGVIERLAWSLEHTPRLRETFLQAKPIRAIREFNPPRRTTYHSHEARWERVYG